MSVRETVERLRRSGSALWGAGGDDEWLRHASAMLDVIDAARALVSSGNWPSVMDNGYGECVGCCMVYLIGDERHADDCPAIALGLALDALSR